MPVPVLVVLAHDVLATVAGLLPGPGALALVLEHLAHDAHLALGVLRVRERLAREHLVGFDDRVVVHPPSVRPLTLVVRPVSADGLLQSVWRTPAGTDADDKYGKDGGH